MAVPGDIALLYFPNMKLAQRPRPGTVVMFAISEAANPVIKAVGDTVYPLTPADTAFVRSDDVMDDDLVFALQVYQQQVEDELRRRDETHFDATGARTVMPTVEQIAHAAMSVIAEKLVAQRGELMPVLPVPVLTAEQEVDCITHNAVKYSFGVLMAPTALVRRRGLRAVVDASCRLRPGQPVVEALAAVA